MSSADRGHTLAVLALALPLAFYHLLLLERKRGLLSTTDTFLLKYRLGGWEKALFILFFFATVLLLVLTVAAVLRRMAGPLIRRRPWAGRVLVALIGAGYFSVVTLQFKVLSYFKDGLSLILVKTLAGGDSGAALSYVRNEFAGLLPVLVGFLVVITAAGWALRRYGRPLNDWMGRRWLIGKLSSAKGLLAANGAMLLSSLALAAASHPLHEALRLSLAHEVYLAPLNYLTDLDGDGYGLLTRPVDFAPWDRSRHPYALEIPGNGIDENGVGGDLPATLWPPATPVWDRAKLEPRNVVLIVADSVRQDVLDATVQGVPVMPTLRALPGQRVAMFSHAGFTIPSVTALLNGTLAENERGRSLIDRFHALGYSTGVFSGQHEGFGGIAAYTRMDKAGVFFDATSFPPQDRMTVSTAPASLAVPAPRVNSKFGEWLKGIPVARPFFAYLNWQEMHFPYHYPGAPTPLIERPIPRSKIEAANRPWVAGTYWNAARSLDQALGQVMSLLEEAGAAENTVVIFVGDHGEELFDDGYLGHGINLSFEQNATLCKVIGGAWQPPRQPVGVREMATVIHNTLVRSPQDALPFTGSVLCYVGGIERPDQIGLVTGQSIVKYDFTQDRWSRQSRLGARFEPAAAWPPLIHQWESHLLTRAGRP